MTNKLTNEQVEYMTEWVTALRSGKYKQIDGMLYNGYGFCCLGVLCEIGVKKGILIRKGDSYTNVKDPSDFSTKALPNVMQKIFPMRTDLKPNILMRMNDVYEDTFDDIADVIESELNLKEYSK